MANADNPHDLFFTDPRIAKQAWRKVREWMRISALGGKPQALTIMEAGCGEQAPFLKAAAEDPDRTNQWTLRGIDIRNIPKQDGMVIDGNIDFLTMKEQPPVAYDVIMGNPPFSHAMQFIEKGLGLVKDTGILVMLLRVNFIGSKKRFEFFKETPPSGIVVLVPRPSFTNDGATDYNEYALFIWSRSNTVQCIEWVNWDGSI